MRYVPIILAVLLAACGTGENPDRVCKEMPDLAWVNPSATEAIILHEGHNGPYKMDFRRECQAEMFQEAGFSVFGMNMPERPHEGLPLTDFIDPVLVKYNDLVSRGYTEIHMVGLSGGGFTTTMFCTEYGPSLDLLGKCYSVAGGTTLSMRQGGDWEQWEYNIRPYSEYHEIYPDLLHIYCEFEPSWQAASRLDLDQLGAPYIVDKGEYEHTISEWTVNYIINDLKD